MLYKHIIFDIYEQLLLMVYYFEFPSSSILPIILT